MPSLTKDIPHCHPEYKAVPGAPFAPGDRVRVVKIVDAEGMHAAGEYIGSHGRVVHLEYDCGCGQHRPDDPMIGIRMDEDFELIEFWKEELELVRRARNLLEVV